MLRKYHISHFRVQARSTRLGITLGIMSGCHKVVSFFNLVVLLTVTLASPTAAL
jgi:hypothetical protein